MGAGVRGGRGAGVNEFLCGGGGGGAGGEVGLGGRWGLECVNLFYKESKSKKKFFLAGGGGGGGGRWMDRRTGPNQFATSTSSKLVA